MSFLLTTAASQFTYRLFDDGVSNILGLETLTHGTNPISYVGIRINGADPNWGGTPIGSTNGQRMVFSPTNNTFHVFKDSEIYKPDRKHFDHYISIARDLMKENPLQYLAGFSKFLRLSNRVLARYHAYLSGYNFTARILPKESNFLVIRVLRVFVGTVGGLASLVISPTLRFRFAHINPTFQNDQRYGGLAYKTTQKISPLRIGLLGSLLTGINRDWVNRIKEKPSKAITGVVQLTAAVAIVALTANAVIAAPVLLTPIAIGIALA